MSVSCRMCLILMMLEPGRYRGSGTVRAQPGPVHIPEFYKYNLDCSYKFCSILVRMNGCRHALMMPCRFCQSVRPLVVITLFFAALDAAMINFVWESRLCTVVKFMAWFTQLSVGILHCSRTFSQELE